MPGCKPLTAPCDLIYRYDGGLAGFYCCVFDSVYMRQMPLDIQPEGDAEPTLLPVRRVETDRDKAMRVREAVGAKVSPRARELVETVFLSCLEEKELHLLRFLLLAFQEGWRVLSMLTHPDVAPLMEAERRLGHEAHLLTGFVRFSDVDGKLISTIRPKNFVLPFLAPHFHDRFPNENYMIYDRTHRAALFHERGRTRILEMDEMFPFEVSEEEAQYRALWKQFYNTLAIEARYNPTCRRSHMPKRYWAEMTEVAELA